MENTSSQALLFFAEFDKNNNNRRQSQSVITSLARTQIYNCMHYACGFITQAEATKIDIKRNIKTKTTEMMNQKRASKQI